MASTPTPPRPSVIPFRPAARSTTGPVPRALPPTAAAAVSVTRPDAIDLTSRARFCSSAAEEKPAKPPWRVWVAERMEDLRRIGHRRRLRSGQPEPASLPRGRGGAAVVGLGRGEGLALVASARGHGEQERRADRPGWRQFISDGAAGAVARSSQCPLRRRRGADRDLPVGKRS